MADHKDLESKAFQGRTGAAFLFKNCVNVSEGETKEKDFTTGRHVVTILNCKFCNNKIGWKYVRNFFFVRKLFHYFFDLEKKKIHVCFIFC